jgi:hypothetical protein
MAEDREERLARQEELEKESRRNTDAREMTTFINKVSERLPHKKMPMDIRYAEVHLWPLNSWRSGLRSLEMEKDLSTKGLSRC